MSKKLVDLELEYIHRTDKAILVRSAFDKEVWLPRSMIETFPDPDSLDRGDLIEVTMPEAYAQEKELI